MHRALVLLLVLLAPGVAGCAAVGWNDLFKQNAAWYTGTEARAIAASIVQYQTKSGGWPKNTDMTRPPSAEFLANNKFDHRAPTIDNGATTTQLRYLARVIAATDDPELRAAFYRGFDYLLAAQYDSGGWAQYFPPIEGYYTHITYNDNAMINVLTLLRDASRGAEPYGFVDAGRRAKAATAVDKGIGCILRTQIREGGKLTAWCAQHDENTFAPAWARKFEPPSFSGMESVGITRFLMGIEKPAPEVIAAVDAAVAWLRTAVIKGIRVEEFTASDGKRDRRSVADPAAKPIWARFYELETNRPIFIGRDSVLRSDFNEIERERRVGYAYYGEWPAALVNKEYPRWREKHKLP